MSFTGSAMKACSLPPENIVLWDNAKDFRFENINRGIVIVFAEWSGVAPLILRKYCCWLTNKVPSEIKLHELNHDSLSPSDMERIFSKPLHGNAETYFVKDGNIIAEIARPDNDAEVRFARYFGEAFTT